MNAIKRRKLNMFVQLSENFLLPFCLFLPVLIRYIFAAAQLHDSHGRAHCLFFLSDHFYAPRLRIAFAVCATAVFELYIIGRDFFFFFFPKKCSAVVGLSVLSFFTFAREEHILLPFFPAIFYIPPWAVLYFGAKIGMQFNCFCVSWDFSSCPISLLRSNIYKIREIHSGIEFNLHYNMLESCSESQIRLCNQEQKSLEMISLCPALSKFRCT